MIISNQKVGESLKEINATCESRKEPLLVQDGEGTTMVIMPVDMYDSIMLQKRLYKTFYEGISGGKTYTIEDAENMLAKKREENGI